MIIFNKIHWQYCAKNFYEILVRDPLLEPNRKWSKPKCLWFPKQSHYQVNSLLMLSKKSNFSRGPLKYFWPSRLASAQKKHFKGFWQGRAKRLRDVNELKKFIVKISTFLRYSKFKILRILMFVWIFRRRGIK